MAIFRADVAAVELLEGNADQLAERPARRGHLEPGADIIDPAEFVAAGHQALRFRQLGFLRGEANAQNVGPLAPRWDNTAKERCLWPKN